MRESEGAKAVQGESKRSERRGFLRWLGGLAIGGLALAKFSSTFGQTRKGIQPAPSATNPGTPVAPQGANPFIGEIELVAFNFAPVGWALCNGQLLPISSNTALFSLLGTTYGGDGRSTFALPNLQGRVPLHQGTGPGLTPRVIGESGGEETHILTPAEMPSHNHILISDSGVGTSDNPSNALPAKNAAGIPQYSAGGSTAMNSGAVASTGGNAAHNTMPPYLTLNYIIAITGIFPSRT